MDALRWLLIASTLFLAVSGCSTASTDSLTGGVGARYKEPFVVALQKSTGRMTLVQSPQRAIPSSLNSSSGSKQDITAYLQGLVDKLVSQSPAPKRRIPVIARDCGLFSDGIQRDGVLQFCVATLRKLSFEAELAFLAAHETSHALLRHGERDAMNIKADVQDSLKAYWFFGPGGAAIAETRAINFRAAAMRIEEREADLMGIDIMVLAGFNPVGAHSFLELLAGFGGAKESKFAATQEEKRKSIMRHELDKPNPDGGAATAYLTMALFNKAVAKQADDRDHDDVRQRQALSDNYVNDLYRTKTSKALGVLPWRTSEGGWSGLWLNDMGSTQ